MKRTKEGGLGMVEARAKAISVLIKTMSKQACRPAGNQQLDYHLQNCNGPGHRNAAETSGHQLEGDDIKTTQKTLNTSTDAKPANPQWFG